MIKQQLVTIGVAIAVGTIGASNALADSSNNPFTETGGRLVVEIESEVAGGDWSTETSIFGFSGDSYRAWRGQNNFRKDEADRGDAVTYHFTVTTPGNYEFRWRSRNTIGLDPTEHNDGWIRFSEGAQNINGEHFLDGWTKAFMGQVAKWSWDARTVDGQSLPIRQFFAAGDYTIEIAGRSNGHAVDRFALYQYENTNFNVADFDATPQSPQRSELAIAGHTQNASSCFANVLSIPASESVHVSSSEVVIQGESLQVDELRTLLRFNYPENVTGSATLTLASQQSNVDLSVYLGSHDNWDSNTAASDMPVALAQLNSHTDNNATNQFFDLSIDDSVLNSGTRTLLLTSETPSDNTLHGTGTRLEPRLNIVVSTDYCDSYNLARTGTGDPATNVDEAQVDETPAENPDNSTPDNGNTSTGTETETETETETSTETDSGPETVTGNPSDENPDANPSETTDTQRSFDNVNASSSSGGSMSFISLLLLGLAGFGFRHREKQLHEI